ncbi:hypothetical protein L195_g051492 [Trifolium pratense]|uniref:Uncharacterized protein n=1 Tax=Trifolium pratense TaxID=57577 RepID=A0A2K3K008_TRIPR|nr:hypothetical protein L195_g051492 [Trifolium pratense]
MLQSEYVGKQTPLIPGQVLDPVTIDYSGNVTVSWTSLSSST